MSIFVKFIFRVLLCVNNCYLIL